MSLIAARYFTTEPLTLHELARSMHAPRRDAERLVQELRLAGVPLVSDGNGIRLARDAAEAAACAAALRRRAISQLLTARALRRTAAKMREAEMAVDRPTLWTTIESAADTQRINQDGSGWSDRKPLPPLSS